MRVATDLIDDLLERGVEFGVFGDSIRFRGAGSALSAQHVEVMMAHRGEVIRYLITRTDYPHGQTVAGRPKTWTGKLVSRHAWRALSAWERHGSTGRMWDGVTKQWEFKP